MLAEELYEAYPDAYFIVTVREPDSWIQSCKNYFGGTTSDVRKWMYGGKYGDPYTDPEVWIKFFLAHYAKLETLQIPDEQITWMHISEEWEPICRLLGKDIPNEKWKWLNKSNYKEDVDG
jgi:hypothetical protein